MAGSKLHHTDANLSKAARLLLGFTKNNGELRARIAGGFAEILQGT